MPERSDNSFKFWQELKRRKVIRVIAMYAATAFIIMEAGDIMLPRLGLPDWTVTFIIILLIIGFPIAVIFSWIFDITPEGLKKTESAKVAKGKTPPEPVKRKLRVGDLIIAVLVVIVCILLYPKIFKKDKFENIRETDGRISIAVMPFQNLTNDTLNNIWEIGIQNSLISSLSNSEEELSVRQFQTMSDFFASKGNINYASITPKVASDISRKLETNTFILGSLMEAGNKMRINAQLRDAATEEVIQSFEIDTETEDDFFNIIDSLSDLVKNYLEIQVLKQSFDLGISNYATTKSSKAFRYYLQGLKSYVDLDYNSAIDYYSKAINIDTSFFAPYYSQAMAYSYTGQYALTKQLVYKLMKWDMDKFSRHDYLRLKILISNYIDKKNPQELIKNGKLLLKLDPQRIGSWSDLGLYYRRIDQYEKATAAFEKVFDLSKKWGGSWKWAASYARAGEIYHKMGNHAREKEVYQLGLSVLPNDAWIIGRQATCALYLGNTTEANEYLDKYRSIREEEGWEEYRILNSLGLRYKESGHLDEAEKFFKQAIERNSNYERPWLHLAEIYIKNDIDVNKGMEFINHAFEIAPDRYDVLYIKGMGLFKQGNLDKALSLLNESWDLRPIYNHDHYLLIQEVEQALPNQNK